MPLIHVLTVGAAATALDDLWQMVLKAVAGFPPADRAENAGAVLFVTVSTDAVFGIGLTGGAILAGADETT